MASVNPWKTFESLLPQSARTIVTVVKIQGTRSMVKQRNGVEYWVNGATVAAGSKAWVVDDVIQSEATDLPFVEVEI